MLVQEFRRRVLDAVLAIEGAQAVHLHLLYSPELADPLNLVSDTRRDAVQVRPWRSGELTWRLESMPRIITLDCRRVAAYLLNTDPGIDDPLFEVSITQAHAEAFGGQATNTTFTNDQPGAADCSVCGWLVGPDNARAIAARFSDLSSQVAADRTRHWVRWYSPAFLSVFWASFTPAQKTALLGRNIWLNPDAGGRLRRYSADGGSERTHGDGAALGPLSASQRSTLNHAPLVRRLLQSWQALCDESGRPLADDAEHQLQRHVQVATRHGLDTEDLVVYAIVAMQVPNGATETEQFTRLIRDALKNGDKLADCLVQLPATFWQSNATTDGRAQRFADV